MICEYEEGGSAELWRCPAQAVTSYTVIGRTHWTCAQHAADFARVAD